MKYWSKNRPWVRVLKSPILLSRYDEEKEVINSQILSKSFFISVIQARSYKRILKDDIEHFIDE